MRGGGAVADQRGRGPALARYWSWYLLGVFCLAFAWRVYFLARLASSPLAGALNIDERIYWEWAGFLLRHGPLGRNPFFLAPLYPYVLALLRWMCRDSLTAVLLVQSTWGAAAAALLADAARRLTSPAAGLAVGLTVAGYEMSVLADGLILGESLMFFLEAALLWAIVREDWAAPRKASLIGIGLLIGALAEARATSILLILPGMILALQTGGSLRQRFQRGFLVLAAAAVVIAPGAARNLAVSGEWIPFSYNFGYNLYSGTNPQATGSFTDITGTYEPSPASQDEDGGIAADGRAYLRAEKGLDLGAGASSRYWARQALDFVRANPWRALRLAVRKAGMFWNSREYSQIESIDEFRAVVGPMGLPIAGRFALIGTLAIAGLWVAWRTRPVTRFLVAYAAVLTIAVIPFFVVDRYRLHLVPGAVLLAALAIEEIARSVGIRSRSGVLRIGTAIGVGAVIVSLPLPGLAAARVAWDTAADLGAKWLEKGRPDRAVEQFEKAVAIERAGRIPGWSSVSARVAQATLYQDYGTALMRTGRTDDSRDWLERAHGLVPEAKGVTTTLAEAYARLGRFDECRNLLEQSGEAPSAMATSLVTEAWRASNTGRQIEVDELLRAAIGLDRTQFVAWVARVRLEVLAGHFDDACEALRQARAAGLPAPEFAAHLALIAAARGDADGARRALAQVPDSVLAADGSLSDLIRYIRRATSGSKDRSRTAGAAK